MESFTQEMPPLLDSSTPISRSVNAAMHLLFAASYSQLSVRYSLDGGSSILASMEHQQPEVMLLFELATRFPKVSCSN
jgi:hypothetical protein